MSFLVSASPLKKTRKIMQLTLILAHLYTHGRSHIYKHSVNTLNCCDCGKFHCDLAFIEFKAVKSQIYQWWNCSKILQDSFEESCRNEWGWRTHTHTCMRIGSVGLQFCSVFFIWNVNWLKQLRVCVGVCWWKCVCVCGPECFFFSNAAFLPI